jgi:glycine/D-amino acid oxidase-like deaminating enzyme
MVSYWEQNSYLKKLDVAIVGAGLLGLWTAYELLMQNNALKITILEEGCLPSGASTRNAGFACFGSPSELLHDLETMGEHQVWNIVDMRFRGIGKMRKVLGDEKIGFEALGGYEVFEPGQALWQKVESNLGNLNKGMQAISGVAQLFFPAHGQIELQALRGFEKMIASTGEGTVDSGQLVKCLSKKVRKLGAQIIYGASVQAIDAGNKWQELLVETAGRTAIWKARKVVVCTNGRLCRLMPALDVKPARGQILLTPPIEGLRMRGTFHAQEGYYYFRNLGNRILLGGARHTSFAAEETTELSTSEEIQQHLNAFVKTHFAQAGALPKKGWQRWAGTMAFTSNKLPLLHQQQSGVWAATCCNGMGVALSPIFAEQVASTVLQG